MHRHSYKGRKFSRKSGPRKALIGGLIRSLFLYESIETTDKKAKEIKPIIDKLITLAKKPELGSRRLLASRVGSKIVTEKIIKDLLPLWETKNSGYTRAIKLGYRSGDGALMSKIELITINEPIKMATKNDKDLSKNVSETSQVMLENKTETIEPTTANKKKKETIKSEGSK